MDIALVANLESVALLAALFHSNRMQHKACILEKCLKMLPIQLVHMRQGRNLPKWLFMIPCKLDTHIPAGITSEPYV